MGIVVRAMEESDIEELITVMKEAWQYSQETWGKGYYPEEAHEFDMSKQTVDDYRKLLSDESSFCFIAIIDGKIAGKISGTIIGKSGFAMIRSVGVHPDFHRKGTGRALMEHAMDFLKKRGCHKVSLNTLPCLIPAINLYLKMGFVPEAYLRKQWWGVDFIYMSKWLQGKI